MLGKVWEISNYCYISSFSQVSSTATEGLVQDNSNGGRDIGWSTGIVLGLLIFIFVNR